ncbi:5-formyltetrahydrofolate cyclo-ligase [Arthrobacter sp. 49Tsu3.1M3]|uniref:5-formyltetrahydrofolate cyclo-ligase n=1 Tax=Arthrobacter sp. 49Tsu3.1M3 TaxID=1279029 RepID=UPI0009A67B4F|nr:5-formyltetrahydrofolate cyclo-ligase [Arthrobacter sp. 49Tsu3.1M3]SKB46795.1 5-formyltetrahydrofolate cyclo-ligase [Arthrobacter sp. 49Tsu3.1M3]
MASKEEIRSSHRAGRSALPLAAQDTAAAGIASHGLEWASGLARGRQGTFAAYLGVGAEPPTLPLLAALVEAGHRVLLPVCEPDIELSWVYWTPRSGFVRSRYAPIQEPVGERHGTEIMRDATAIFVPATAVDFSGNRIGQGGGYYDKFLAALAAMSSTSRGAADGAADAVALPTAAVVYDTEVLPAGSIPAESFDRKVDTALTPGGIIRLGRSRPA